VEVHNLNDTTWAVNLPEEVLSEPAITRK